MFERRANLTATPIYRANISVRAVTVPAGHHWERFTYPAERYFRGLTLSSIGCSTLFLWAAFAKMAGRR